VGRRITDALAPPTADHVLDEVGRALDEGRTVFGGHVLGRGIDRHHYEATTIPLDSDRVVRVVSDVTRQRRWWRELQASEGRFRQLFEQAVDGIFVYDEFGRLLDVNPRACSGIGYSRRELLGTSFPDLFPALAPARLMQVSRRLRPPQTATLSAIHRRYDGSTFPVELRIGRMAVEGPARYLAVVRDVTDRRNVERVALDAAEEEQRRIGRDLHDGLGQHLAGLGFMAKALERSLSAKGLPEAEAAAEIRRLVEQALGHSRALAHGLAPVDVHGTELVPALEGLAQDTAALCGIECEFELVGRPRIRDETTATALYRIAQEAVTNALRHADASRIEIRLEETDDGVELRVRDDGRGLPAPPRARGLGQRLMAMRAERIRGTLDIGSTPGRGTTVRCLVGRQTPSEPHPVASPVDPHA
jgi:two-component system CheB/CheR fusion protein